MKPSFVFLIAIMASGKTVNQNEKITPCPSTDLERLGHGLVYLLATQWGWLRKGFLLFILFITILLTIACFAPCLIAMIRKLAGQVTYQQMMILYKPEGTEAQSP
ncbi:hypothetical protein G0U57_006558 [Chelydra serpentina]|uniref:Uncharacterized protein n=1 Tax=Chelydra serpentina TaxID=8475 RepID=A0A8T1SKB2_CHESE|nr:hypothetical protein G0U57_006558 [Chelydra serpentina]